VKGVRGKGNPLSLLMAWCCLIGLMKGELYGFNQQDYVREILPYIIAGDSRGALKGLQHLLTQGELDEDWRPRVQFLLGYLYQDAGEVERAERYYRMVRDQYKLRDYVDYRLARLWLGQKKTKSVIDLVSAFLSNYPRSPLGYKMRLLRAHAWRMTGDYARSIRNYRELLTSGRLEEEEETEALYGWAEALRKTGSWSQAWELYSRVYFEHPGQSLSAESRKVLEEMDSSRFNRLYGERPSSFIRRAERLMSLGHYQECLEELDVLLSQVIPDRYRAEAMLDRSRCLAKLRKYHQAIEVLEAFLRKYPKSSHLPRAYYQLASYHWKIGSKERTERLIRDLKKRFPSSSWTEKALFILALIREEEGQWEETQKIYQEMIRRFPRGRFYLKAYWRWGWLKYKKGDYLKAIDIFNTLISKAKRSRDELKARATYWCARSLEKTNQRRKALIYYERLLKEYPLSYYGIKAGQRLPPDHQREIEVVKDSPFPQMGWSSEQRYYLERVQELATLGLYPLIKNELRCLYRALPSDEGSRLQLARFLYRHGLYYEAIKLISGILQRARFKGLPRQIWQMAYPLVYWEHIQREAEKYRQDPYLILAIIRQESAFQLDSLSVANAQGLMQILPSTGRFISRQLGQDDLPPQTLFNPYLNISLGVWYLDYLWKKFRQNIILALAGYNAGPQKVEQWLRRFGPEEMEEFIEDIPYRETRGYVKRVIRNWFLYRKLYQQRQDGER